MRDVALGGWGLGDAWDIALTVLLVLCLVWIFVALAKLARDLAESGPPWIDRRAAELERARRRARQRVQSERRDRRREWCIELERAREDQRKWLAQAGRGESRPPEDPGGKG